LNKTFAGAADTRGALRVDYLRGDTRNELSPGNTGANVVFRWRDGALLGTNTNAEPKIVQAPRSGYPRCELQELPPGASQSHPRGVYLGANDGMLHGFDTAQRHAGAGLRAARRVPQRSAAYTDPAFIAPHVCRRTDHHRRLPRRHRAGRPLLVGAPGAGGQRACSRWMSPTRAPFSEANAASLVKFDYTAPRRASQTSAPVLGCGRATPAA
jgi:hypothetical protein